MQNLSSSPISVTYRQGNFVAVVQLLGSAQHCFGTPLTAAYQASLSFTISLFVKTGVCLNSCPLSWWCHPTVSSFVIPFSSCLQFFPASGSLAMSQLFPSSSQSIGASASASFLPVNIQGWFPLGFTGLIPMLSKRLSRDFSSTTVQKHQFFSVQPSLWSNSQIHSWLLKKP